MKSILTALLLAFFMLSATAQTKIQASAFKVIPMGYNYDVDGPITVMTADSAGAIIKFRLNACDGSEFQKAGICTKTQPGALEGKSFTKEWLASPGVFWLDTMDKRDKYNRIVGRIWKVNETDSQDLTYQTIWYGWTWYVYDKNTPVKSRKLYSYAEQIARLRKVGVFADTWDEPAVHPKRWKKMYGLGNNFRGNKAKEHLALYGPPDGE